MFFSNMWRYQYSSATLGDIIIFQWHLEISIFFSDTWGCLASILHHYLRMFDQYSTSTLEYVWPVFYINTHICLANILPQYLEMFSHYSTSILEFVWPAFYINTWRCLANILHQYLMLGQYSTSIFRYM